MKKSTFNFIPMFALASVIALGSSFRPKSTSPIHWINKTFTVNFDTLSNSTKYAYTRHDNINSQVYFEFENTGNHVTFLDGSTNFELYKTRQYITKPKETNVISYPKNSLPFFIKKQTKKDTLNKLILPFYYEGETFLEEVEVFFTFGKSKLIDYDKLEYDLTDSITKLVDLSKAANKQLSLRFRHEITIKNTSNTTILCSERFVAWNDAQYLNDYGKMIPIKPGETYILPVELNMDKKYRFKCNGYIQVKSNTMSEQHYCEFVSKYVY